MRRQAEPACDASVPSPSKDEPQPRWKEFIACYLWVILKNIIGWTLILASFVIGPFIPGPGGIPMFLIGFALITLPGKRRLTARVLRGRTFHFWSRRMVLAVTVFAVAAPGLLLLIFSNRSIWLEGIYSRGPLAITAAYSSAVAIAFVAALAALRAANVVVQFMPRVRKRVRPWLRRHHVRLLPPRRRRRQPHERDASPGGRGPIRLKDEIIAFLRHKPRSGKSQA